MFIISGTNDKLWNTVELIEYLVSNQNQSIKLRINPEAIDLDRLGIYKILDIFNFEKVDIFTHNPLEGHDRYNIINCWKSNKFMKQQWMIEDHYHSWNRKKLFLAFYHRPTAGRLAIASYLLQKHEDKSLVHFSCQTNPDDLDFFELDKVLLFGIEAMNGIPLLLDKLPIWSRGHQEDLSNINKAVVNPTEDIIYKTLYKDVLIDIVVESHVLGKTFFPTEKTVRPIWLKKPFIIFGSKDYLDYLHQMGFKTFCNYWSEEYDGYDGRDRYIKISQLIEDLSSKPISELEYMYKDMKHILDHNYDLLQKQIYKLEITYIE